MNKTFVRPLTFGRMKDVPGFEGLYRVDDFGRVWSSRFRGVRKPTDQWRLMKLTSAKGHFFVNLNKEGRGEKSYVRPVHRLVLESFVGPRPPGYQGRHLDSNPANNRLDNLAWGTPKENSLDRIPAGTFHVGEDVHSAKLTWKHVRRIRQIYSRGGISYSKLGKVFGVGMATISDIIKRRTWK